jgi:hypothetical protein
MKDKGITELPELIKLLVDSQQRVNEALVSDIKLLRDHIIKIEKSLELVEARREAELKERTNEI